ncbi:hypothetical protein KEM55_002389 [Ascosphaera atra]|nr:hypothetical protein KEM55_002389 [Ascosphaera atra]
MVPPTINVNDTPLGSSHDLPLPDSPSPADPFATPPRSLTPTPAQNTNDAYTTIHPSIQYPEPPYSPARARSNYELSPYVENRNHHSSTELLPLPYSSTARQAGAADSPGVQEHLMASGSHSPSRSQSASGNNSPDHASHAAGAAAGGAAAGGLLGASGHSPYYQNHDYSQSFSHGDSSGEEFNTKSVVEKFTILPDEGMLVAPEVIEADDYLHNPGPNDKERDFNFWNRRAFWNIGGLFLLLGGVVALFVALPMSTWLKDSLKKGPTAEELAERDCKSNPLCIMGKDKVPNLKNVRTGLIDPDTPDDVKTKKSADGKEWHLVFSDEFATEGRSFYPQDDPFFQGVDLHYAVTQDLEWYDLDAITTSGGALEIRFDKFKNHNLDYRSGMLQSWNMLCFQGGRLEASISLPGKGDVVGFWPGFWTMGNLGRPGYAATTEGMWPYSYDDVCDAGITPNQSSPDGMNYLPGMKLPACTCKGEDHPSPGKSRSAPEIDVIEASSHALNGGNKYVGDVSQSFQIAPFDIFYMPDYDMVELYDPKITMMNTYTGGPFQQAMSGLTTLNNDWYDGKDYQIYAVEYTPGSKGDVTWFVGEDKTWKMDARAIGPNGNIGQRVMPMEPMSIVLNFGMSPSFAAGDEDQLKKLLPATMRVDYIRIYQDPDSKSVTCDPKGYETTEYIEKHNEPYTNFNLTSWDDTDFYWPKNSLMNDCEAEKEPKKSSSG